MADLLAEGDTSAHGSNGNGNGNGHSNVPRPPIIPPVQTSSPRSNIRGPRMIMQERQEREARRAEQERLQRAQAEQDARVLAEQRRQAADRERVAAAAAVAAASAAVSSAGVESMAAPQMDPATQRRQQRAERAAAGHSSTGQSIPQAPQQPTMPPQASQQRPIRLPQTSQPPAAATLGHAAPITSSQPPITTSGVPPATGAGAAGLGTAPGAGVSFQAGESSGAAGTSRPRNSFPHAFERWEALSAHWEGLTSFWIRQLQQRSEEIDQDPLSRQLARQVTDLSAAGANLFHAVVELQRLRASSERKFQRWFFEMRGDMERNTERQGMLEAALQEERRGRAEAIREALENDRSNSKIQKQLAEMRKELAISKEEARRAWEELGRREQEERDRVTALQEGQPTIVGGVQVVPMTHGLPTRHRTSSSVSQEPQHFYQTPPAQTAQPVQPVQPVQAVPQVHLVQPQQTAHAPLQPELLPSPSHSAVDLLPSQQHTPHYTTQAPVAGPSGSGYTTRGQEEGEFAMGGSEVTFEEEEEAQDGMPSSLPPSGTTYPPSSSQHYYAPQAPPTDYSGQGYAAPGWETMPRHHHPTRLSDVMEEEDERSRTSASQLSRG